MGVAWSIIYVRLWVWSELTQARAIVATMRDSISDTLAMKADLAALEHRLTIRWVQSWWRRLDCSARLRLFSKQGGRSPDRQSEMLGGGMSGGDE